MDHNLEDTLNLESAIGEMDFEHSGDVVVSQADITLDTDAHGGSISMEFDQIEVQPNLMDTGNEEIIDFMSDQFSLQEYSVQDDQTTTATTTEESNQQNVLTSQADPLLVYNLPFEHTVVPMGQEAQVQPKYIAVKAAPIRPTVTVGKKHEGSAPRQVAIAPKPPKLVPTAKSFAKPVALVSAAPAGRKQEAGAPRQVAIAPKPVALAGNKAAVVKKLPLAGVVQAAAKGNTVLAQIGKQLVMMPSGHQKIKLVTSGSSTVPNIQYIKANTSQAQLITTKSGLQGAKPIMAKVIVPGQSNADAGNQQTVITKIVPSTSTAVPQTRYVMQQKTVPISLGNKVLLATPTKQGVKFAKKQQIIAIKSPTPKLVPAAAATATKKVVISANPPQNVILKTTAPPKAAQITKDGKVVLQGQRSQLHQINVPGKGIQYIRLITNQTPAVTKTVTKSQASTVSVPPKSFVLTDNKGNLIQMSAEKMISGQPPPLVFTGNPPPVNKWQQKLVRIAAAPPKPSTVTPATSRSSQSLLAPLSPLSSAVKVEAGAAPDDLTEEEPEMEETSETEEDYDMMSQAGADAGGAEEAESKAALRALVADAPARLLPVPHKVEVTYDPSEESPEQDETNDSMEHLEPAGTLEEQLIVIPSNYIKTDNSVEEDYRQDDDRLGNMLNMEAEAENSFLTPRSPPQVSDSDMVTSELGLRPRRACNCTKSQCLKLYCDCFANGEFCNRCNCNNCYNNLNYEELRQKAIRACLERNPNAFRPKIGKSKTGGPEIIRRHNKGCNCKRSGCLKNYCECYEAKIACTSMCKCFGCRNVEETLHRARRRDARAPHPLYRPPPPAHLKQPCSFMTADVIEAVCQCLIAASVDGGAAERPPDVEPDPVRDVIEEFSRCLQDIISASHQATPLSVMDEGHT